MTVTGFFGVFFFLVCLFASSMRLLGTNLLNFTHYPVSLRWYSGYLMSLVKL